MTQDAEHDTTRTAVSDEQGQTSMPQPYWGYRPLADIRPATPRAFVLIHQVRYDVLFPEEWSPTDRTRLAQAVRPWEQLSSGERTFESFSALERTRMLRELRWVLSQLLPGLPDYVYGGLALNELQQLFEAWTQFSRDYVEYLKANWSVVEEALKPESPADRLT